MSKKEIIGLEKKLADAKKEISELKKTIRGMKSNFLIQLYNAIENITTNYNSFLNPHPIKIKVTLGGRSDEFEIKITNVICVVADKRAKKIYLKNPVKGIHGELKPTNKIVVDRNFNLLLNEFDSMKFHLFRLSRGKAINIVYYDLNNGGLILQLKNYAHEECMKFAISKSKSNEFIGKQKEFRTIYLLQKKLLRYNA
jgi:hypothetical protein